MVNALMYVLWAIIALGAFAEWQERPKEKAQRVTRRQARRMKASRLAAQRQAASERSRTMRAKIYGQGKGPLPNGGRP
jgi:hypothetical protein